MRQLLKWATVLAAGAAAMYLLDPVAGRRRRAMLRQRAAAAGHDLGDYAGDLSRHAADRVRGVAAEARAQAGDAPVGDTRLHERIRSQLGHLIAEPARVEVQVHDGEVVLRGAVKPSEIDGLVEAVSGMQGVRSVDNRLEGSASAHPGNATQH